MASKLRRSPNCFNFLRQHEILVRAGHPDGDFKDLWIILGFGELSIISMSNLKLNL